MSALNLDISYQQLHFSSRKVFLGWNLFDMDNAVDTVRSGLRYSVMSSTCDQNNISTVINTTNTSAVFALNGDDNVYSIVALNDNGDQNNGEPFRISSGGRYIFLCVQQHSHCVTQNVNNIMGPQLCEFQYHWGG